MTTETFHDIEAAGLAAWPCFEQESFLGWHLRFAEGFTKRANSVNAGSQAHSLSEEHLEHIECRYTRRGLPTIFRLYSLNQTPTLDDLLGKRGYSRIDPSLVMTSALAPSGANSSPEAALTPEQWLTLYYAISGKSTRHAKPHLRLLQTLPNTTQFAVSSKDGAPVSCGLGVLTHQHLGLFEIATKASYQRQGLASALCRKLMSWGASLGAHTAFLQVEHANLGAIRIYEALGFERSYDYWYRVSAT